MSKSNEKLSYVNEKKMLLINDNSTRLKYFTSKANIFYKISDNETKSFEKLKFFVPMFNLLIKR